MDKRYQVFLSSTFLDLKEERIIVASNLRKAGYFVSCMEDFSASPDEVWEVIKNRIDESDYYVLFLAGKYGTMFPGEKISYTEKEYRYANEREDPCNKPRKPCISLIIDDIGKLARDKTETEPKLSKMLEKFSAFVKTTNSSFARWQTKEELVGGVLTGLINTERKFPSSGWVRGTIVGQHPACDFASPVQPLSDALKQDIPDSTQFEGELIISFKIVDGCPIVIIDINKILPPRFSLDREIHVAWEKIFRCIGREMCVAANCSEDALLSALTNLCEAEDKCWISENTPKDIYCKIVLDDNNLPKIKLKFQRMKLIEPHPNSLPDATSWRLTEKGKECFFNMGELDA
jgi:hypothetical protein